LLLRQNRRASSDDAAYKTIDALNAQHKLGPIPFPAPRGGVEPVLTLAQALGKGGDDVVKAIAKSGQLVFHAVRVIDAEAGRVGGRLGLREHRSRDGSRSGVVDRWNRWRWRGGGLAMLWRASHVIIRLHAPVKLGRLAPTPRSPEDELAAVSKLTVPPLAAHSSCPFYRVRPSSRREHPRC
jgi:hypothetical protein